MNFAAFSTAGAAGAHYVTSSGQIPVAKLQQNVGSSGTTLSQVVGMVGGVGMGDGVQYVRALDGGATLQTTPQIISLPITLPGCKPGDPQPTVQIQVLNPSMLQPQQQKYQMQIPIQGFQQGGAVLTVAYSPEANDAAGIHLVGGTLPEGLQVLAALPQEMQLVQPSQVQDNKDHVQQAIHNQVFLSQNQQNILINDGETNKALNNNTSITNNNSDITNVVIKEEFEEHNDEIEENAQNMEKCDDTWQLNSQNHQDLLKYLRQLPPQQTQVLPAPLQQFLRMNTEAKKPDPMEISIEVKAFDKDNTDQLSEAMLTEDGILQTQNNKKKKKYRKKPSKPARPKPGQVVIAQAADGTPIFCCPECQMAYPDKEQLEMHLAIHKIERRFICGICGAGLKRKEHLERHKLGHNPERPYVCGVCRKGFKRREHLNLHTVIHSGVKSEVCTQCGKGFYRKDHLRKHTRSHESRRQREEAGAAVAAAAADTPTPPSALASETSTVPASTQRNENTILSEITIHVPTSGNMNMPVHINIPQHVVTSLAAAQQASQQQLQQQQQQHESNDSQSQLEALFAVHT